jgi:hypothetical protein
MIYSMTANAFLPVDSCAFEAERRAQPRVGEGDGRLRPLVTPDRERSG